MLIADITAAVRRDIREPSPVTVSDTEISDVVDLGAEILWEALVAADKDIARERVSLQSTGNTNFFALPSDCLRVENVWDMKTNAIAITDATNATPIVVTAASHGFSNDQVVRVHGVLGNTDANGTWKVDNKTTNTLELADSVGNGAYTSGGYVFQEKSTFRKLTEISPAESSYTRNTEYYMRGRNIVVDYPSFSNDLVLDYLRDYNQLSDIPAKMHTGLTSYAVLTFLRLPDANDPNYGDIKSMLEGHNNNWKAIKNEMVGAYKISATPDYFPDNIHWDAL